jgi:hypothetical protein
VGKKGNYLLKHFLSILLWVIQNSFKLIATWKWNFVETGIVSVIFGFFHSSLQAANSSTTCNITTLYIAVIPLVIGTMLCNRQIDNRYFHPNFLNCWCGKKKWIQQFWLDVLICLRTALQWSRCVTLMYIWERWHWEPCRHRFLAIVRLATWIPWLFHRLDNTPLCPNHPSIGCRNHRRC